MDTMASTWNCSQVSHHPWFGCTPFSHFFSLQSLILFLSIPAFFCNSIFLIPKMLPWHQCDSFLNFYLHQYCFSWYCLWTDCIRFFSSPLRRLFFFKEKKNLNHICLNQCDSFLNFYLHQCYFNWAVFHSLLNKSSASTSKTIFIICLHLWSNCV